MDDNINREKEQLDDSFKKMDELNKLKPTT